MKVSGERSSASSPPIAAQTSVPAEPLAPSPREAARAIAQAVLDGKPRSYVEAAQALAKYVIATDL